MTISWPNDGWYQVLDANDYSQICNGGASCEVDAGRYIVINHTTGQRFENVVVRGETDSRDGIQVIGNTISWADDGWYQVQRADDYSAVCNGGSSCEVDNGVFTVINHTTGTRYPGILVDGSRPVKPPSGPAPGPDVAGPDANGITVSGNTISWPDNGWYQVQSAETYESLCEGGTSCDVLPGVYFVINLTTGERFEGYVVEDVATNPGTDPVPTPSATLLPAPVGAALDDAAPYLVQSLAGYQLEQANVYLTRLGAQIEASALGQSTLEPGSTMFYVRGANVSAPVERVELACQGGGSMIQENALLETRDSEYSQDNTLRQWVFSDCRFNTQADGLSAGDYTLDGVMSNSSAQVSASRSSNDGSRISYENFMMMAPNDTSLQIDASVDINNFDSVDSNASRKVVIERYTQINDGAILRDIRDGNFDLNTFTEELRGIQNFAATANGRILGTVTQGMDITISTVDPFARQTVVQALDREGIPFKGQLQLSSTDGSEMTVLANPAIGPDQSFLLDYTLLTNVGDTRTGTSLPAPDLPLSAPGTPLY